MRILFVVPWDEEFGGVASVVGNLARYLQSRGHEVSFLHPGKPVFLKRRITRWGFLGFEIRLQRPFGARHPVLGTLAFLVLFPVTLYQLIRLILKHRIDIVNVHYPWDNAAYFAICSRILAMKLVSSVHGADIFPGGKPRIRYSRAMRSLLSASALIVASSQRFRKDFLSLFPAYQHKTVVIHNGLDLAEVKGHPVAANRDGRQRYLLCIAAHNEKKGIDVLLHAVKRMQERGVSSKMLLVGDGPLRGQLEDLSVALGVHEQVEFLGQKGRAQVAELLHGCDIFVLPSRSEPFGMVILEAMACEKPVVATTVGGIPEIIENGKNGMLVEPDRPDALAEVLMSLLRDQALRQDIAKNGYVTVHERFSYENTGMAYEAVFGNLLGDPDQQGGAFTPGTTVELSRR